MIAAVRSGDLYHPSYGTANGGICKIGTGFVLNTVGLVDDVVPAAGLDVQIWTTPNEPFMLEHGMILLTGQCTAGQNPGTPIVTLKVGGAPLVTGNMTPWTGTTYALSGANLVMWMGRAGLGLLDNYLPDGSTVARGAMVSDWSFAALHAGSAVEGFWNKPVTFHVEHGAPNVHMNIPFRAFIVGRFL
jgi:hypothetical protein